MASSEENIAGRLKGNTLRTYVALLSSEKGVMGGQRASEKAWILKSSTGVLSSKKA
jgi:hypothetical protein